MNSASTEMMFLIASIAVFVSMALVLLRLFVGPTVYDRVLSMNAFGTQTVLFIDKTRS